MKKSEIQKRLAALAMAGVIGGTAMPAPAFGAASAPETADMPGGGANKEYSSDAESGEVKQETENGLPQEETSGNIPEEETGKDTEPETQTEQETPEPEPDGEDTPAADESIQPQAADSSPETEAEPGNETIELGKALEDDNGIEIKGASEVMLENCGTVLKVSGSWNDQNQGHAEFKDTSVFKSGAFTLLADIKITDDNADGTVQKKKAAFAIGTEENNLHIFTMDGKLGYGKTNQGGDNGGLSDYYEELGQIQDGWNSLALVYEENDDGTTSVTVYLNGELSAEIGDVGFKLSEQENLTATIGRSFNTSYLLNGYYDGITAVSGAMPEEQAKEETAKRHEAKQDQDMTETAEVTIRAEDVESAVKKTNGLSYKGWGLLSGNSTSNLLMDYKAEHPDEYWEMIEYLFGDDHPLFSHVKMEMGNDGNNSTGADACTMRTKDEEADASRSPGFQLAADAKSVNPDLKVSVLRWNYPSWISGDSDKENLYLWYRETIFDAYEKYGYVVDYVDPDRNETSSPNAEVIKYFAEQFEKETEFPDYFDEEAIEAYHNIKIVASDENKSLNILPLLENDEELKDVVDAVGFHYRTDGKNGNLSTISLADEDDKEVWYSEGCATFGYTELQENKTSEYGNQSIGGYQSPLAMVDGFITSFVDSRRTHYIFQPAIGSFYEGIQYAHKELLSARDPWSGHIHYDPALYVIGHFSKFAETGWENEDNTNGIWRAISQASQGAFAGSSSEHATAGINGNAGYMTLASPDKEDFSVVFVNNTQNEKKFYINPQGVAEAQTALQIWETAADSYGQQKASVEKDENGGYTLTLAPYSITTATTLSAEEASLEETPESEDRTVLDTDEAGKNQDTENDILYADDFEYEEEGKVQVYNGEKLEEQDYLESRGDEPRYLLDSHGAFVVEDGQLKQDLGASVGQWNGGDPMTIVGDFRWMNYKASIDVSFDEADSNDWAGIGVRSQRGMNWNEDGYTLHIEKDGDWNFYRAGTKIASGSVDAKDSYNLAVEAKGNTITAIVDGVAVSSYTDEEPFDAGRVKISCAWEEISFDNLKVEKIDGYIPYATDMIDGQDDGVTYEGSWSIENPGSGSADDWYRTLSKSAEAGASFTFKINGTGFSIIGPNDGDAVLGVTVDGETVEEAAETIKTGKRSAFYTYKGLENAEHEVTITLKEGSLSVDALYTLGETFGEVSDEELAALTEKVSAYQEADYVSGWAEFQEALSVAQQVLKEESADQEKIDQAYTALFNAEKKLLKSSDPVEVIDTAFPSLTAVVVNGTVKGLPETVRVRTAGGQETTAEVSWKNSPEQFAEPYASAAVTGTVKGGKTENGEALTVSVPVEVLPDGLVYFADSGATGENAKTVFQTVKEAVPELKNDAADQTSDGSAWGHLADGANVKDDTSDSADKYMSGLWAGGNKDIVYYFPLEAGTYELTAGFHEWWGMNRPMSQKITWQTKDGETETVTGENVTISGYNSVKGEPITFTIAEDTTIAYTVSKAGSSDPVISWVGIAKKAPEVETITLNQTEAVLYTNADPSSVQLEARITPENAGDKTVTWSSSDESVASVNADGLVTAKGKGTAVITAKAGEKTASCQITVKTRSGGTSGGGSVTVPDSETMKPEDLGGTVPEKAESSDTSVVKVSVSGEKLKLTAAGAGTAEVRVTGTDGKEIWIDVTVDKKKNLTAELRAGWKDNRYYRGGALVKGEFIKAETENDWYFTDEDTGEMIVSDWAKVQEPDPYNGNQVGTVWYHMGEDGKMQRGWIKDESGWKLYNLDSNGRMRKDMWIRAEAQEELGMPEGIYHLQSDGAVQMNGWAESVTQGIYWFCNAGTGVFEELNPASWGTEKLF